MSEDDLCPCLPPDHGDAHYKREHDNDCGGQTFDPPCGGCMGCIVAQIAYYAALDDEAEP